MVITVNGDSRELADGATVEALIAELSLADAVCAAEVNKVLIPKAKRSEHQLADGDAVEIVTLVGGG